MRELFVSCVKAIRGYLKYILLTLILLLVVGIMFGIMCKNVESSVALAITSGVISVVGGALASVVIAWILEISNRKEQADRSKRAAECILEKFDFTISRFMKRLLAHCAKNDDEFDINKVYSFDDVINEVQKPNFRKGIFPGLVEVLKKEIDKIDVAMFLFLSQDEYGKNLFSALESTKSLIDVVNFPSNRVDQYEMAETVGVIIILSLMHLYEYRGEEGIFVLDDSDKEYVIKFREAKRKPKEES